MMGLHLHLVYLAETFVQSDIQLRNQGQAVPGAIGG